MEGEPVILDVVEGLLVIDEDPVSEKLAVFTED